MSVLRPVSKDSLAQYEAKVSGGLNAAYQSAAVEERNVDELRVIVFSDLHRGARDGADDFERCEPAYNAALGWYLEEGYELFLLGDVEELWENDVDEVIPRYADTAALELAFKNGPGLRRFYGNHDLDWRRPRDVERWLNPVFGAIDVLEALRLVVLDDGERLGELFLVHGHQGTDLSDRASWLSRLALRRVWRHVQRSQGWLSTTPAENHDLRHKHDQALFHWAHNRVVNAPPEQSLALIAGHTHHTVFPDTPVPQPDSADAADLAAKLGDLRGQGADASALAAVRAALERARALGRRHVTPPVANDPPCYFNTGCCCFPDRYITGLELADGELRLVRWDGTSGVDEPHVLAPPLPTRELFAKLAAA